MKLSTAINKANKVYATVNIAACGVSIQISKNMARKSVAEFLSFTSDEDGNFTDGLDNVIGWYDQRHNDLYIG
jgi:prenyltransferase beta subunit